MTDHGQELKMLHRTSLKMVELKATQLLNTYWGKKKNLFSFKEELKL